MKRSRKWAPVGAIVVAVTITTLLAFSYFSEIEVDVVSTEHDVDISVFGLGTVEAETRSELGFEILGTLETLGADDGDRLAAGATLATLDASRQIARREQVVSAVLEAEQNVSRASGAVARAEALRLNRARQHERRAELAERGAVAAEMAEASRAELDVAEAELQQARSALALAQAAEGRARAALAQEELLIDKHRLLMPYDGVIVARHKDEGSIVMPGEPLFTVFAPRSVRVLAYIDELAAGPVRIGQRATITLRSAPSQSLAGRVARVDVESDRVNEERRVLVEFERLPEPLFLGEQAEVVIHVGRLADALLLSESSLIRNMGDRGLVWVVQDGELDQREIDLGGRSPDGRIEVRSELPEGMRIVDRPIRGMRVGRAARVR